MLHMTAQQLVGGPRYSAKVRLGNWSEDEARFHLAAKDYEVRREKGELLHLRKAREKAFQTQRVPHTFAPDGLVRYGDTIQLAVTLDGKRYLLANNVFAQATPGNIRTSCTTAVEPQARNTFVIQRTDAAVSAGPAASMRRARATLGASLKGGDDVLRVGDRIVLASNPSLTVDPATKIVGLQFLLQSQRANNVIGSGRKGAQECTMSVRRSADAEWQVVATSGDSLVTEGAPVRAGDDIMLVHCMSNQALAATPSETTVTDFGVELEPHVQTYRRPAHASMSVGGVLPLVTAQPANTWQFVLAERPEDAEDERGFRALTPEALLERASAQIAAVSGMHGMRSLALAFVALDEKGTGRVVLAAARLALFEHGVTQGDEDFRMMLAPFDKGGVVYPAELMAALRRDSFTRGRAAIAAAAYEHVVEHKFARAAAAAAAATTGSATSGAGAGATGTLAHTMASTRSLGGTAGALSRTMPTSPAGCINISELKLAYDAKFDLRVRAGLMSVAEANLEFQRQWPAHTRPDALVSADDFMQYYEDVAACVSDDFEFIEMVANVWHVPGHGNWKPKKSKRVLLTFHKGSSTEAVIPEAEDIPDDDFEGLSNALKGMGFGGIARVKVLGTIDVD